jgi:hypothetical protein
MAVPRCYIGSMKKQKSALVSEEIELRQLPLQRAFCVERSGSRPYGKVGQGHRRSPPHLIGGLTSGRTSKPKLTRTQFARVLALIRRAFEKPSGGAVQCHQLTEANSLTAIGSLTGREVRLSY